MLSWLVDGYSSVFVCVCGGCCVFVSDVGCGGWCLQSRWLRIENWEGRKEETRDVKAILNMVVIRGVDWARGALIGRT